MIIGRSSGQLAVTSTLALGALLYVIEMVSVLKAHEPTSENFKLFFLKLPHLSQPS
jgi:hypothetical protein